MNVLALPLEGIVTVPETEPPAPPLAPFVPQPPPPPFIANVNVVTHAGSVTVWLPAVLKLTDAADVVPWNEELAVLTQVLPTRASRV